MQLKKKLTSKQFFLSQFFVFLIGFLFLITLYYILNIQYQKNTRPFSMGPVTTSPKTLRLNLDKPDDDSLVFQNSIIISGQTTPFREVLIFTDSQDLVITSKKDGSFST